MEHKVISEIRDIISRDLERERMLLETASAINRHFPEYNWVGFYFVKGGKLHIGPYLGKPTPHTVIDIDKGICGAAVREKSTIIVDDVNADPRYLACSLETKSEIVIPIYKDGSVIGELDIDSDRKAAFSNDNKEILESIVKLIEEKLD